jgi:hypothetical protein
MTPAQKPQCRTGAWLHYFMGAKRRASIPSSDATLQLN